jgi:hypothetical protein
VSDLTIRTRPNVDIPLAIVAIGLTLLLAFTARGAIAAHPAVTTPAPVASPVFEPSPVAPAQAPAPKEKDKGPGHR